MSKIDIFEEQNHDMVDSLEGQKILIYGGNDTGKAIPTDTMLPTPDGYKKAEDIKLGDYLFGSNGNPTKVTGVFPQSVKKDVWEIEFEDGRIAKCSDEHLWEVYDTNNRKHVLTLSQIVSQSCKTNDKENTYINLNYSVPLCRPVEYGFAKLTIDPYVMGIFLADGSFRKENLTLCTKNIETVEKISNIMGWTYVSDSLKYNYTFKKDNEYIKTKDFLSENADLINKYASGKHIPENYLLSSIDQRLDLLNGFIDADGEIDIMGGLCVEFSSKALSHDFLELCYSLGLKAKYKNNPILDNSKDYAVKINSPIKMNGGLFVLKNRKMMIDKSIRKFKRKFENKNSIAEIRKLPYKVDMVCFKVENKDHLYLMNDYIVTHNTFQATRMEKPMLLMAESGGNARNVDKFAINSWDDFVSIVSQLTDKYEKAKEKYQTIIIDTVEELVSIVENKVAKSYGCLDVGMVQQKSEGNPNGYQLARNMFRQQTNLLTKFGYTVVFISHETVIDDYVDPYSGKKITKIIPFGSNKEKGSTAFVKNLCDFVIYTKARGIDPETHQTIRSMAICKETSQIFARSRYTQMQSVIEDFTAENLKEAILTAIHKEAENEGAGLSGFKKIDNGYTKEDYFDMIKPYMLVIFRSNPEYVNAVVSENIGVGKKLTDATDDQLVELSKIYNDFVSYCIERDLKI